MTVCERIDEILRQREMSRRQLAITAGIAPSSFQSAMQRNGTLSLDMLFPISDVLNVSILYLATGRSEDPLSVDELESLERDYWATTLYEDDVEFYNSFLSLTEDDKETIRRMVEVMRERRKNSPQD